MEFNLRVIFDSGRVSDNIISLLNNAPYYKLGALFKRDTIHLQFKILLNQKLIIYRERLVNTLYFNGRKLTERLEDTPEGRNKWHAGGQWFLGQDQVCYFINCFFILKCRKY